MRRKKKTSKPNCKAPGCTEEMHAREYCNKHYKRFMRWGNPLAGGPYVKEPYTRTNKKNHSTAILMDTYKMEPEKRKPRTQEQNNFAYFVNQSFIETLFKEAVKTFENPLYSVNENALTAMLTLAANMAGYDGSSRLFLRELINELTEHVKKKDPIRFAATLANWDKLLEEYNKRPKRTQQLSFFNNEAATPRKNSKTV